MNTRLASIVGLSVVALVLWLARHPAPSRLQPVTPDAIVTDDLAHSDGPVRPVARITSERRDVRGLPAMSNNSPPTRNRSASASTPQLEEGNTEAIETLKQTALSDPNPVARAAAVRGLGTMTHKSAHSALLDALSDDDADVRLTALHQLAWAEDATQLPASVLADAVHDPEPDIRIAALGLLDDLEDPEAASLIQSSLDDEDDGVRAFAESLWDKHNPE